MADPATLPPSAGEHAVGDEARVPGVLVVFTAGAPSARALAFVDGAVELGRGEASAGKLDDGRVSRRHARVEFRDGWLVTDLGSQNGTFVDGEPATAHAPIPMRRVVRVGDSLLVPCADIRPFEHSRVREIDGFVRGPAMQAVLDAVARAARAGTTLHVRGESGTGKEGVAQAYHRAGPRAGHAFVAVNCATIPSALAERLLFGTKRGTYSGAEADASGHLQEADGGTLFLDEVAELDTSVQAKLLRVLETCEVVPLGASKPRKVDVAFCSATNKDLRALVAAGALREDLFYRIATPMVTLPALRDRPEEIPALIAHVVAPAQVPHVSLVEECLLRPWPGNVRELVTEVQNAARAAVADPRVAARHLASTAGQAFGSAPNVGAALGIEPRKRVVRSDAEWRQRIEDALRASAGNVAAAARALSLHRTQLRRMIDRHGLDADSDDVAE